MSNNQQAYATYIQLLQQGVPASEAMKQAFPNGLPTAQEQKKQQAKSAQGGQLAGLAGTVGGVAAAKAASDYMGKTGWFKPSAGNTTNGPVADGTKYGSLISSAGGGNTTSISGPVADAHDYGVYLNSQGATTPTSGAPAEAVKPTPLAANETVTADGNVQNTDTGQLVGRAVQGVGGAYLVYRGYQDFKDGDKVGGGLGMAAGGTNMAAAYYGSGSTASSVAPYLTAAVGAYNTVNSAMHNQDASSKQQAQAAQANAAMTVGNVYTFGLLGLADALAGGRITKQVGKESGRINKVEDKLSFGMTKKIREKVFHQSTRGVARQHTGELANQWQGDQPAMNYLGGMREQYNSAPKDPAHAFAGKYATWDDYKKGGLQANDLTGVYGNLKVYGPAWAGLTQSQREQVTQANINDGLYDSKKGEVILTNNEKAMENFKRIATSAPQQQAVQQPAKRPATKYDVAINKQNNAAIVQLQNAINRK